MGMTETGHDVEHVAGFSLLGSLGKRVLRPGGAELTDQLLDALDIGPDDDVLEIAPGRGRTARLILARGPASYVGVDRDESAQRAITPLLHGPDQGFRLSSVSRTGLDDDSVSVAIGEAVLTMHPRAAKAGIIRELARVVRPGGRVGLHEVAFQPDDPDAGARENERISEDLTSHFKVSFNAMSMEDWTELLDEAGFELASVERAPLRLLEPDRIIADEGLINAAFFIANVLIRPQVLERIIHMRTAMRRNAPNLRAVAMVAVRRG